MTSRFADVLVLLGLALTTAGIAAFDWRVAVLWAGVVLLVAGLLAARRG